MTKLLVVGSSGFIGAHVAAAGLAKGWDVTGLSLHPSDAKAPSKLNRITADIADRAAVKAALGDGKVDYVVNCGGYIDHTLFVAGGRKVLDAHLGGVMNLVEALDRKALQAFVNIGSSDEYGGAPAPQAEAQREAPISPYSMGKAAATHFLQMLHRSEGFPSVTLRLFLTYGPGQGRSRFLPQIIAGCLENKSFPVSAGEQLRDFCYVDDTVSAIFAAMERKEARGEVVNIGSGQPVSIRKVVETVRDIIGAGDPRFGQVAYRPGENMALYADISRAQSLLGWKPRTGLEEGIRKTIAWIKSSVGS